LSPKGQSLLVGVGGNIHAGFMQGPMPLALPHTAGLDVAASPGRKR
jgi:hypothetical protein